MAVEPAKRPPSWRSLSDFFHDVEGLLEVGRRFLFDQFSLRPGHRAKGGEFLDEDLAGQRVLLDRVVKVGLGEGRFVALVVPVAAVAEKIDDHVASELLAEIEGDFRDQGDGHGVLAIDVKNGGFDHLGHVGGVEAGARVGREGGEADLVVHHDVQGAAGFVAGELRHVEDLGHDALSGEGGVAVDEKGKDFLPFFGVAENALPGAGHPFDHGIDRLEMARVGGETHPHGIAGLADTLGEVAEVVFHVAIAADHLGEKIFRELVEDEFERFAQEIGQDVEPAAVGHPHDDFLHPDRFATLQDGIKNDEQRLGALEGETFLPDITRVEEVFEGFGFVELAEDGAMQGGILPVVVAAVFDALPDPVAQARILDVHELGADGLAVNTAQFGKHFAEQHRPAVAEIFRGDGALEIAFGETDGLEREERVLRRFRGERVETRDGVPEGTVGVGQRIGTALEGDIFRHGSAGAFGQFLRLGQTKLETLEKGVPLRSDRFVVFFPALVVFFEQFGVPVTRQRLAHGGADLQPSPESAPLATQRRGSARNFRSALQRHVSLPPPRTAQICPLGPAPKEGAGLCAMIKVEGLTKKYAGITAVKDLNFTVEKGEIVGFLGPNGAGKSTTMRILSCYLSATSGTARVAGFDVASQSREVRSRVGYMPENVALYPEMRVQEYLEYRAALKGVRGRRNRQRVNAVKELCNLREVDQKLIGALSKGYRQRVGLADALLHDPDLLILDEPTIGLDPNQIRQVRQLIKDLGKRHTILLSTHILSEVEMTCSRVLIIDRGRIAASDTPEALAGRVRTAGGIRAEIRAGAGDLEKALAELPGVRKAEVEEMPDGWQGCVLRTDAEHDPREAVARLAAARGWALRELGREQVNLERVFAEITQSEELR